MSYSITCPVCQKVFFTTNKERICCSRVCSATLHTNWRQCPVCGKTFRPHIHSQQWCSKPCGGLGRLASLEQRFWQNTHKTDACWIWTGNYTTSGYGRIGAMERGTRTIQAHRLSWELHNGPIPDGMQVCHRCDNPPCVNPDHLFLGTMTDNMRDMAAKGRQVFQRHPERAARGIRNGNSTHPEAYPRGEQHHKAKLTEEDVRTIRSLRADGCRVVVLSQQFGVATATIKAIVRRKTWKHI